MSQYPTLSMTSLGERNPTSDFSENEHNQVKEFLDKCHLPQYYATFINEGFESLQAVLEITEEDLVELNVKRGHRRVIQRGIATLNGIPKNQPLPHLLNVPTMGVAPTNNVPLNKTMSKPTNGNNSSENSSGNYSTSGYGSMSSPRHISSRPYESSSYASSSNDNGYSNTNTNNNNNRAFSMETLAPIPQQSSSHSLHRILHQDPEPDQESQNGDVHMKDTRSSFSSEEEEEEEDDDNNSRTSRNSKSSSVSPLKRKYRRHPKPDKNAPIKPPSAYIMFSNDARAQLKDHNMTFVEIAKLVGDQWKNMSANQKQQYERTAMRAKDEYIDALNEYRRTKEYKDYQKYLSNFKAEQDATNRKIARMRKRAKRESPGSGITADSSSYSNGAKSTNGSSESNSTDSLNTDNPRSSTSSGSVDIYKAHRRATHLDNQSKSSNGSEESYSTRSMDAGPSSSSNNTSNAASNSQSSTEEGCNPRVNHHNDSVMTESNEVVDTEAYSPQQKAPPLISDSMATSNYHRLPFNDEREGQN